MRTVALFTPIAAGVKVFATGARHTVSDAFAAAVLAPALALVSAPIATVLV